MKKQIIKGGINIGLTLMAFLSAVIGLVLIIEGVGMVKRNNGIKQFKGIIISIIGTILLTPLFF